VFEGKPLQSRNGGFGETPAQKEKPEHAAGRGRTRDHNETQKKKKKTQTREEGVDPLPQTAGDTKRKLEFNGVQAFEQNEKKKWPWRGPPPRLKKNLGLLLERHGVCPPPFLLGVSPDEGGQRNGARKGVS